MARIPGIDLDEIYAKYELHPSLIDIYVEGEFDRDFLVQIFQGRGLTKDVSIFTIDTIEIPNEHVINFGLDLGSHKYRVITLAMLLHARLGMLPSNVSCIIDIDNDDFLNKRKSTGHLLYTDFNCMEMYALNVHVLKKFFFLASNLSPTHVSDFLLIADKILPTQFCIRAVNENLELNAKIPDFSSGLKDKRDINSFDHNHYLKSFTQANSAHANSSAIKPEFDRLYSKINGDLRHKGQGHDFVSLLFAFSEQSGGIRLRDKTKDVKDYGGRIVMSMIDSSEIFSEKLFSLLDEAAKGVRNIWPEEHIKNIT